MIYLHINFTVGKMTTGDILNIVRIHAIRGITDTQMDHKAVPQGGQRRLV